MIPFALTFAPALAVALAVPQGGTTQPNDQSARITALERQNAELVRRLDLLADDVERAQHGDAFTPVGEGRKGLAPAASKIYDAVGRMSIGGYGEMLYVNEQGDTDTIDFLRAILYFGYKFDDRWLLNSEFEFEHASAEDTDDGESDGSVSVEFAYVEYQATDALAFRAGLLLLPMGLVNEIHEPTTFFSAHRPVIENQIIPTTWRENGIGAVGEVGDFEWRAYVVNGFDASGFRASGLRGGRQKGSVALAEDFALVGRADYRGIDDLLVGVSGYYGDSGQELEANVTTTIVDVHAEYHLGALRLRGVGVWASLDDVDELNAELALTGDDSVGEELCGYYVEAGYDVLRHVGTRQQLIPFVRYEALDTQADVPSGFASEPARDQEFITFGVAWKPHDQLIFKMDYVDADNDAGTAEDLFRLSMGYVF